MSTPTPRTDAQEWTETNRANAVVLARIARTLERELYAVEATLAIERGDHLRDLAAEREKVRVLRSACESICEEWGKNHDAPFCAGSEMEKLASKALEKTEDAT